MNKILKKELIKLIINPIVISMLLIFLAAGIWQITYQVNPLYSTNDKEMQMIKTDIEGQDSGVVSNIRVYGIKEVKTDSGTFKVQPIRYIFEKDSTVTSVDRLIKVKKGFLNYHYNGLIE